jgi:hypothetical protein
MPVVSLTSRGANLERELTITLPVRASAQSSGGQTI